MSNSLNESPVLRKNVEYINRLENRANKLRERLYSYRNTWNPKTQQYEYRHIKTNRRITKEKYHELREKYYEVRNKTYEIANREDVKVASKLKDIIIAFIVMDKKLNPKIYPNWLSLEVGEPNSRSIVVSPYVNLEKLLEEEGNVKDISTIEYRIIRFSKTYLGDNVNLDFKGAVFRGLDNYIKNVFRKVIRPRIMKEVEDSNCIHSIVFRSRNRTYRGEIQIHPRFRDEYRCRWSSRNNIEREIRKILREYGWISGRNYTNSTQRD